jgi:GNAT superfamily N-acetyltransferase
VSIVEFDQNHLEPAAELVSQRYQALRADVPHLPDRYGRNETLIPMLADVRASGPSVAALRDGELVGFLAAFPIPSFRGQPAVISPEWGNAVQVAEGQPTIEAMYAELAAGWVADRRTAHLTASFANDRPGLRAWNWLGFGMAAVDAVRGLDPLATVRDSLEIRRGGPDDAADLLELERALQAHLAATPIFLKPHADPTEDDWLETLSDPEHAVWLAQRDGKTAAYLLIGPASQDACTIIRDSGTASITGAFTRQQDRGTGVCSALLDRALRWAAEMGYERCAVDFEPMNPPARRFWLRTFEPVCYVQERHIDARAVTRAGEAAV